MSTDKRYCCDRMKDDLEHKCDQHPDPYNCADNLIARVRGGFGIIVHDGGSSVIEIKFCPWCGTELHPIQPLSEDI